jgi:preprotein translocase subunit SecA
MEDGWDQEGYRQWLIRQFPVTFEKDYFDDDHSEANELAQKAANKIISAFKDKLALENAKITNFRPIQEGKLQALPANEALRHLIIRKIDQNWQEHLLTMDHLRSDVNLRSVGQRDPLMEFKHEAFQSFDLFGGKLRSEVTHDLFRFEIVLPDQPTIEEMLSRLQMERSRSFLTDLGEKVPSVDGNAPRPQPSPIAPIANNDHIAEKPQPVTVMQKVGRNDFCPCGSGKKYKKCCGVNAEDSSL